jgi:hypothetical protein
MSTFRDWIPDEGKKGSEGSGFADFVPTEKQVEKPKKVEKSPKKEQKLSDEDLADLGIDKAKLEALEKEQS